MNQCLVVDDSKVVRMIARKILEDLGLAVSEAASGINGLSVYQSSLPDVILLDWNMPDISGIEFLRKLRRTKNGNDTLVIFCMTEYDVNHIAEAEEAGANICLKKPFDTESIEKALSTLGLF